MIKRIIIALAFPLSVSAQDTLVVPDSERIVRISDMKEVMAKLEDKVTVREYKLINEVFTMVFNRAMADYRRDEPKKESK